RLHSADRITSSGPAGRVQRAVAPRPLRCLTGHRRHPGRALRPAWTATPRIPASVDRSPAPAMLPELRRTPPAGAGRAYPASTALPATTHALPGRTGRQALPEALGVHARSGAERRL